MTVAAILHFLHVGVAMLLVGGLFARQLTRSLFRQARAVSDIRTLTAAAGIIEGVLVIPGSAGTLVLGLALGLITGAPILGFLQGSPKNWLLASNLIFLLFMVVPPAVFVPRGRKFEAELKRAGEREAITPDLRDSLNDPVVAFFHGVELVGVVVIVALMTLKPF